MAEQRKKDVEVVRFEKPADRSRTVLDLAAPMPRDTLTDQPALIRRRTTLEIESPVGEARPKRDRSAEPSDAQVAEMALFGHRLFEQGKIPEAKIVFEGIVELGVEDPFPHTMLGIIYLSIGDTARALALFEAALALDPEDLAARVYRAEIRLRNGKVRQALEELGKIARDCPKDDPFAKRARKLIDKSGGPSTGGRRRRR